MTKEGMMDLYYYYNPKIINNNYKEALNRIKVAMLNGEKFVYLPGKNSIGDFNWVATRETIEKLKEDGYDIDKVWDPYEYWSVEWGY